jgi:hypothetical protein
MANAKNTENANVPTTSEQAAPGVPSTAVSFTGFKVKKQVVLPILTLPEGVTRGIRPTAPMYEGKDISEKTGKPGEKIATLLNCVDLSTGQECMIVVPALLEGAFADEYENDDYVGRDFAVLKGEKPQGKRYHRFSVAEIDLT